MAKKQSLDASGAGDLGSNSSRREFLKSATALAAGVVAVGVAGILRGRGSARVPLVDFVAADLSKAGRASLPFKNGVGLYSQRSAAARRENQVGQAVSRPPNLGLRRGKIPDRSGLVVLPFLGSGVFADAAWVESDRHNASDCSDLLYFGRRQCGRLRESAEWPGQSEGCSLRLSSGACCNTEEAI